MTTHQEEIGKAYLDLRKSGVDVGRAATIAASIPVPPAAKDPSCIDKYGRPDDVTARWAHIQVR